MRISVLLISALLLMVSCGGKPEQKVEEPVVEKKYALYGVWVFKSPELNNKKGNGITVLAKAEPVDLLQVIKGEKEEIAQVKLSDDTEGYMKAKALGDKPLVFIRDTPLHRRNNEGSRIYTTIPAGTIGFVIDEKANWVKVWAGRVNGKWIGGYWTQDGFSFEQTEIVKGKELEKALDVIAKAKDKAGKKYEKAKEFLNEMSTESTFWGQVAQKKLEEVRKAEVEAEDLAEAKKSVSTTAARDSGKEKAPEASESKKSAE